MPLPPLCDLVTRPLRWLPRRLHGGGLALLLNRVLAPALADGELDFLHGKTLAITVDDLGIRYGLRLADDGFVAADGDADVRFAASLHTLLLLATQREDADSLFFQRRLRIEGDTATGLHLKNFIDALGEPPLPPALQRALERFTDLHGRHCAGVASSDVTRAVPTPGAALR